MKIGILSGSFNPIHIGHLILGNYISEYTNIDQVWYVVTPHNPFKEQESLLDENERLKMVELATKPYEGKLLASDFEFHLPRPSYTIDTLTALSKQYPEHEFHLIIGGDNWDNIARWKNYDEIIKNYKIIVYPRLDSRLNVPAKLKGKVEILDSPIFEISSTDIREAIEEGKDVRPYLPTEVFEYITANNLYQLDE